MTRIIAPRSQKYFADQWKHIGELNGHVEEMYTGHTIVKAFGRERKSIEKFNAVNDKRLRGELAGAVHLRPPVPADDLHQQHRLRGRGRGGRHHGDPEAPSPSATSRRSSSTRGSSPCPSRRRRTSPTSCRAPWPPRSASSSSWTRRRRSPDAADAPVLSSPRGEVRFENVRFSYKEDVPLIEGMNLDVKQGQTIAIVGPDRRRQDHAGEPAHAVLRDRRRARITVDGVDIRDVRRGNLRCTFGMVLQDTWLFNGTIRDNIAYGRDGVTDEEVHAGRRRRARGPLHPHAARTATTRCSTRTRPTSRRARSSS